MECSKCSAELVSDWIVCPFCGRPVNYSPSKKKRGNGQGTVYKLKNGSYIATVTTGYHEDETGLHRSTRSKVFKKKSDAIAALADLKERKPERKKMSFKELYEAWLPTHRAGKSTIDCYTAAFRYFAPLQYLQISDIDVDDLQECIDECPHGKRTKQNMKAVCGLVYKYGIPRNVIPNNLNLAQYLTVDGEGSAHRDAFTDIQIEKIKKACGVVPQAELIYCMIYLGFRPSEFLALKKTDIFTKNGIMYAVGGAKTDAGKGRTVPISLKIRPYIVNCLKTSQNDYVVPLNDRVDRLKTFTNDVFYPTLEAIGIDNPMVEIAGGKKRHKYTPHTCRHTFATLMKRVDGADKDKQELIGHSSAEMLRYYQDISLEDLDKIIESI